jgi:SNF2 family DNA or RNA helicase
MEPAQSVLYKDAYNGVLKELRDKKQEKKINLATVLALIQYLMQIACTAEVLEIEKTASSYSCKIKELKNILEEEIGDKQVVVFCGYPYKVTPFIVRDLTVSGYKTITVSGKDSDVTERIQRFKDKEAQVLICSDVISYGYNLQFMRYVVNFNLPWNPALLDQRIARVYRKGQQHNVVVLNLITKETIDEKVLETISEKRKLFESVLGYGKFSKTQKPKLAELMKLI